jgi:putative transposase
MVESLNYRLRKITRNRGYFPTDDALFKLLYLGARDGPAKQRQPGDRGPGRLGWKAAINQFGSYSRRLDIT